MNRNGTTDRSTSVTTTPRSMFGLLPILAAGACLLPATAGAQQLAFSHDDFSGTQGANNWYYGFFDGDSETPWSLNDFEQFPTYDGIFWRRQDGPGGYWTSINRDGGHPNGTITSGGRVPEVNWAVRRWVSPGSYVLNVSGRLWDANPSVNSTGNGVIGSIMVDGSVAWQGTLAPGNEHGLLYDLQICTVPGTIVDFAINPNAADDLADDTGFHARIRTIIDRQPESTLTCSGGTVDFFVFTLPGEYTYQWRHNGVPIEHDGDMHTLRIVNVDPDKVGVYDCIITNHCGFMISDPATLTICDADFDCDGIVDSQDFFTYLTALFEGAPRADINHNGVIDSQDFFDFLSLFFNGCME